MQTRITANPYLMGSPAAPAPAERARAYSTLSSFLVFLLPLATIFLLNFFCQQDLGTPQRVAGSFICLVTWLPFVYHVCKKQTGLPLMPVLSLVYGIYFGWVLFLNERFYVTALSHTLPDDMMLRVEMVSLTGIIMLISGYYTVPERVLRGLPRIQIPFDLNAARSSAVYAGVGAVVFSRLNLFIDIPVRFVSAFQIVHELHTFSIVVLFYVQLKQGLRGKHLILLWGLLVPVRFLDSISSGAVGAILYDGFVILGTYWVAKKKWPWRAAAVFGLLVIPLLGVKGQYRAQVWSGNVDYNIFEKTKLFIGLITEGATGHEGFFKDSLHTSIARIDQATTFGAVMSLTPDIIPYWGGDSYATIYWSLIPRAIYPDKPTKNIGQDFGHRYGLLDKRDRSTSYNLPQMVELYANFGPTGVVVGMFLIGVLVRMLYYLFTHPMTGDVGALLAVVLLVHLCNIESDFSLVYGGLALNIFIFAIIVRLMHTRRVHIPL